MARDLFKELPAPLTPYDWQEVSISKCVDWIKEQMRKKKKEGLRKGGILVWPTGGGKSLAVAQLVKRTGINVVIIHPNVELLEQNAEKYESYGGRYSIYSASANQKVISNVTFSTLKSIVDKASLFRDYYNVKGVIIDEGHSGYPAKEGSQILKFLNELDPLFLLTCTATPIRLVSNSLGAQLKMMNRQRPTLFNEIIDVVQINEISEKYWTPIEYVESIYDESHLELNKSGSEFTDESIKRVAKEMNINNQIYTAIKKYLDEGFTSILCYVDTVETGNILAYGSSPNTGKRWFEEGTTCCISSKTPKGERRQNVIDFKAGKIKVMFNFGTFVTGFDHKPLQIGILGRPTNSFANYYQMCVDEETEILTVDGFKKCNEITTDNIAYGFDISNGEIKKNKINSLVSRSQYSFEKILSFDSHKLNFRLSDHHDMIYACKGKKRLWKKGEARKMLKTKASYKIPTCGIEKSTGLNIEEKYLEFLGWFLSDGSYIHTNNKVSISQSSTSENLDYLLDVLDRCGFKYSRSTIKRENEKYSDGYNFVIPYETKEPGKTGWKVLEAYIDRGLSDAFDNITKDELKIVLRSLIAGNGCNKRIKGAKTHRICIGNDYEKASKFQSLFIRKGFTCTISTVERKKDSGFSKAGTICYYLNIKDLLYSTIPGENVKDTYIKEKFVKRVRVVTEKTENEKLWCINTEMGTIVTRRHGKVVIMGNCGRGVRKYEGKEKFILLDLCGNVRRHGRLEKIIYEDVPGYGWAMTCEERILTGVDINGIKPLKRQFRSKHDWRKEGYKYLHFGSKAGIAISDLETSYLRFLMTLEPDDDIYFACKEAATVELQKRTDEGRL